MILIHPPHSPPEMGHPGPKRVDHQSGFESHTLPNLYPGGLYRPEFLYILRTSPSWVFVHLRRFFSYPQKSLSLDGGGGVNRDTPASGAGYGEDTPP